MLFGRHLLFFENDPSHKSVIFAIDLFSVTLVIRKRFDIVAIATLTITSPFANEQLFVLSKKKTYIAC